MCGIEATFNPKQPILRALRDMSYGDQHRGYESAGVALYADGMIHRYRELGKVDEAFRRIWNNAQGDDRNLFLHANVGIGQKRYSTTGDSKVENGQPILVGKIAIGHNGNERNVEALRERFKGKYEFSTTTDSELIGCIFDQSGDFREGAEQAFELCDGSYNLVLLNTSGQLGVFCDPYGFQPLHFAVDGDSFYAASENSALKYLGMKTTEMKPGQLITISGSGNMDQNFIGPGKPSRCLIEHAYFMNPDSVFNGVLTDTVRRHVGRLVARRYSNRIRGDIVVPVMESGISYAYGISDELGIPVELCLAKNHDIGRTFMVPEGKDLATPEILRLTREETAALKHRPIPEKIRGRRIVGAEDSVIRANVIKPVTRYLAESGADAIDWLIGYMTVGHPCYYGKNHSTSAELIAAGFDDHEEAGRHIARMLSNGVPVSVNFGTLDDWVQSLKGLGAERPEESYCYACHDGKYPVLPNRGNFVSLEELRKNASII